MKTLKNFFHLDDPFLIQFASLKFVGIWYIETDKKWLRVAYGIYKTFAVFSLTLLMFVEIADIIAPDENKQNQAERFSAAVITCIITSRTHQMLHRKQALYDLRDKFNKFEEMTASNSESFGVVTKASKRLVKGSKIFCSMAMIAVFFWTLLPKLYGERKLPFPIRLPIDTEQSPYYEILYVYLALILIVFTASVVVTVLGIVSYLTLINAHFEVLKRTIENIAHQREEAVRKKRFLAEFNTGTLVLVKSLTPAEEETEEKRLKDARTMEILKSVIETQKYIYEEVDSFKELHSKQLLVHISGLLIGLSVIETTGLADAFTIHLLKRILIVWLGFSDIFLICFLGENLQHKSTEVAETLYTTPWYEMDEKVQKVILIMTIRSRRPCILKAGGTIRMNLATYLNILRVAYNFMLLLRHTVITNT